MKFLIHSNGPTIATGYGVQTRYLIDALASQGHEVAVSCTYGHQGPIGVHTTDSGHKVRLYPSGYETNSPDIIVGHAEHWFEGDPDAGWIILLLDVWCFDNPILKHTLSQFNVVAWTPVDHFPAPPAVLSFLKGSGAIPVAMSRFGADLLAQAGLDAGYVPLSVDTKVYRPTPTVTDGTTTITAREMFGLPLDAFVVGMVAMNKDPFDRKGFNEAFRAFSEFWRRHNDAILYLHTDKYGGAGGIDLVNLAIHAGVPEHAVKYSDQYAYRMGFAPDAMAALYTSFDVLLAPSHGEGFGVPLIEAQACGVPVIVTDFSSQPELVGAGWKLAWQPDMDHPQRASYAVASIPDIIAKLEAAYGSDLPAMQLQAIEFAAGYDTAAVFEEFWLPFLATLLPPEPVVKDKMKRVDVLVPIMRDANRQRFAESFFATAPDGKAGILIGDESRTFAENVNALLEDSTADWVLVVGDDVEFTTGWFNAARELSDRFDVIGTNDSEEGRVRNPDVAKGRHADHFFVRREYIDDEGASLDGPGVLIPTAYTHWFSDREVIGLAKARGVYGHAHDCRIIHHHPGYDGNEDARRSDPFYLKAYEASDDDHRTFMERAPLIEGHRVTRVAA